MTATPPQSAVVADALAFLAEQAHVYLLGRRPDGYPTGYAMMGRVRDGGVEFSTYRASAKVRNLVRDGVASILAVSEVAEDDRVLHAEGPVAVLDGTAWLDAARGEMPAGPSSGPRAVPSEITDTVAARHASGKRCVLRVTIEQARFSRRWLP